MALQETVSYCCRLNMTDWQNFKYSVEKMSFWSCLYNESRRQITSTQPLGEGGDTRWRSGQLVTVNTCLIYGWWFVFLCVCLWPWGILFLQLIKFHPYLLSSLPFCLLCTHTRTRSHTPQPVNQNCSQFPCCLEDCVHVCALEVLADLFVRPLEQSKYLQRDYSLEGDIHTRMST